MKEETNPSPDGSPLHLTSIDPREDERKRMTASGVVLSYTARILWAIKEVLGVIVRWLVKCDYLPRRPRVKFGRENKGGVR